MPSCTCMRTVGKFVTAPKRASEPDSESPQYNEAQSIVTDSEVFDHQALLNREGSTDVESQSDYSPSRSDSGEHGDREETETEGAAGSARDSEGTQPEDADGFDAGKLRNTVERWNELLKEFDENPDVAEVSNALTLLQSISDNGDAEETQKQVDEAIRRLTTSLAELKMSSVEADDEAEDRRELVLQPYEGDDEETYFRCFVRKLREQTGSAEVELEVTDAVADNIQVLFNSLGLSRRTLSMHKPGSVARMSSSIKSSTVFKNLFDPLDLAKSQMDLTAYLHQLSNQVDNDDLASVSTLSELGAAPGDDPVSNCLLRTSLVLDEAVCDRIKRHNRELPAFCTQQIQKQLMLRNRYGDMSDLPLFIS